MKDELLLNLIPIAFNEELEGEVQTFSLFVERKNSINIIWDFILMSFRLFGEPEGLAKCYYAEFKRLDKFFVENSTLSVADSEIIVDIFLNIVSTLMQTFWNNYLKDIEILQTDITTTREYTDIAI